MDRQLGGLNLEDEEDDNWSFNVNANTDAVENLEFVLWVGS